MSNDTISGFQLEHPFTEMEQWPGFVEFMEDEYGVTPTEDFKELFEAFVSGAYWESRRGLKI